MYRYLFWGFMVVLLYLFTYLFHVGNTILALKLLVSVVLALGFLLTELDLSKIMYSTKSKTYKVQQKPAADVPAVPQESNALAAAFMQSMKGEK